jgi:kinesin family protein C2/C3
VFTETSKQEDVYREVEPLIESVLDGFNVCIFAYGQTGSGKTYTMEGPSDARGVNSRSLCTLFELVQKIGPEVDIDIEVSMLEIYNDNVRDLLVGDNN